MDCVPWAHCGAAAAGHTFFADAGNFGRSFHTVAPLPKKYGLDVSSFSFERVCQLCSGLEPQAQRRFLSDAKQAAYAVERIVRRGLREMELSVTPEADYSVEQKADVKESGQPKPGKVKKAAQPERE